MTKKQNSQLIHQVIDGYGGHCQNNHLSAGHQHHYGGFPVELNLEMSNTPPPPPPGLHLNQVPNNRHSLMMVVPPSYVPMDDPSLLNSAPHGGRSETSEGPLCASSPKRSVTAFTTFGQRTPISPTPKPNSGHLV